MGGEDPPRRAPAAPPMGTAEAYRQQQKRPPAWTRKPGVRVGREKPRFCPPSLSVTQHAGYKNTFYAALLGRQGFKKVGGGAGGGHGEKTPGFFHSKEVSLSELKQ